MKILIVCSGNYGAVSPFILEQNAALEKLGVSFDYFLIKGKGPFGYLKNIFKFRKMIRATDPDLVHAHYGLSGLLAVLQRLKPVVVTFHGTDINSRILRWLSEIVVLGAKESIFVSKKLQMKTKVTKSAVIPCGIDLELFTPMDKNEARRLLNLQPEKKYILFASAFDNLIKNYPLAKSALALLNDNNVELLELKGRSRKEVALLMNACDVALMTSFSEGSPQFIKEALACNTPVVSTDVGDVKDYLPVGKGCFITTYEPRDVADKLKRALAGGQLTTGRSSVMHFDNARIAASVHTIYSKIAS
jgi:teichuronic acid biosynthesis glycosyltransferase TuaC